MDKINELTSYLAIDHHPDTWAEYSSAYAREIVEGLDNEEWRKLKANWQMQSDAWQIRLIDVIYAVASEEKYSILEKMTMTGNESVRSAAIEALELNTPIYTAPQQIAEYLLNVKQLSSDAHLNERIDNILRFQQKITPSDSDEFPGS